MRLLRWLLVCFVSLFIFSVNAAEFEEGKYYVKIDRPYEEKTVVKIYSVYCPYCFKYEKSVTPALIKSLPKDARYEAWSLSTKGKYGEQATRLLAMLYSHKEKSVADKVKMAYYSSIHDKKNEFSSADDFIDFGLKTAGMSRSEYDNLINSPETEALYQQWQPAIEVAKIQGVPAFLVNGQYLIKTDAITSLDMFNKLVNYLLTL